jgi:hypothetical protein
MIDKLFDGTWILIRVGVEAAQLKALVMPTRNPKTKKATDKRFRRSLIIVARFSPHLNLPPSKRERKK